MEQVTPVSSKVTKVQEKLMPETANVSHMKQYYPSDDQPLDSLVLKSEPEETNNYNIVLSDSERSDSAIVNTMLKDPAESENSTKSLGLLDNIPNGRESLNWDTQND